eukprot:CAMPEP_0177634380 /NCGR_PEP_ID=MMETSP0447-20121125/3338_1 /TAXON_ID=0 /ORGANISM="Stygamoeba regulata, Strain BSH-02190019" /LENGTH=33 /DNA_ID= /DNA_START= /DNA_END= /DNA_ORIENTATION=
MVKPNALEEEDNRGWCAASGVRTAGLYCARRVA